MSKATKTKAEVAAPQPVPPAERVRAAYAALAAALSEVEAAHGVTVTLEMVPRPEFVIRPDPPAARPPSEG